MDVREHIDAFDKFTFESQFQKISTGGCISYVEIPNMRHNLEALKEVVRFIYDNIQYAEFNTKSDYCQCCGYDGEITINDDLQWECPACHNTDQAKMNVTRRTCGYLGRTTGTWARPPGCFNPETWDFQYGQGFGEEQVRSILDLLRPGYIRGLTLLGASPWPRRISRRCSPWYAGCGRSSPAGISGATPATSTRSWPPAGWGRWTGNFFMSWMCWWTAPSFWSRKTSASVSVAVPTSVSWMFPRSLAAGGGPLVGQPPGLNPAAALSFQGCRALFLSCWAGPLSSDLRKF